MSFYSKWSDRFGFGVAVTLVVIVIFGLTALFVSEIPPWFVPFLIGSAVALGVSCIGFIGCWKLDNKNKEGDDTNLNVDVDVYVDDVIPSPKNVSELKF